MSARNIGIIMDEVLYANWSVKAWDEERFILWIIATDKMEQSLTDAISRAPYDNGASMSEYLDWMYLNCSELGEALTAGDSHIMRDYCNRTLVLEDYEEGTLRRMATRVHVQTYEIILDALSEICAGCSSSPPDFDRDTGDFKYDERTAGEIMGEERVREILREAMKKTVPLCTGISYRFKAKPGHFGLEEKNSHTVRNLTLAVSTIAMVVWTLGSKITALTGWETVHPVPPPVKTTDDMIQLQSRPRVLLIGACSDPILRDIAEVTCLPGREYEEERESIEKAVAEKGPFDAFGGLFVPGDKFPMKWDAGLLGALAPRCKVYVGPGAGYDKVDIDWITSTGAYYCNSPRAVGRRTADGAVMLLLAAMRGMVQQDMSCRAGEWWDSSVVSKDWRECTLGFLGFGNIGTQIAAMSKCLGFKRIIYHTRHSRHEAQFEHVSLERLYAESDALVITCPLTPETRGMLDDRAFEGMKDGVVLVNVARGPIVNDEALVKALQSGKVLRAALDVFTNEPEIHPDLRSHPRVILSPHCAAAPGPDFAKQMNAEVIENIVTYLTTGKPQSAVNLDAVHARLSSSQALGRTQTQSQ